MTARKAIIGLCAMCALLVSAFAAQAASAAGTTAYTEGSATPITNGVTTEGKLEGSGPSFLTAVVSGVEIELEAETANSSGTVTVENSTSTENFAHGAGGAIVYGNVKVNKPSLCAVSGGSITTNALEATTLGQGDSLKFTPPSGTFASFTLVNNGGTCVAAGSYNIIGSVNGVPSGTETIFTESEVTGQKTLRVGSAKGPVAGFAGKALIYARANSGQSFTHLEAKT